MKKTISVILAMIMLLSCSVLCANAARPPQPYGDIDNDELVTVLDATCIQKFLVDQYTIDAFDLEAADLDGDSAITILDATTIQQYEAGYITEFAVGSHYIIDKYFYSVTPSYTSGKAYTGVAVDFEVMGHAHPDPSTTYLIIDGEVIETKSGSNPTFTYTFEKAGTYSIFIAMEDKWGYTAGSYSCEFTVVDAPENTETPQITNIKRDWEYTTCPEFTVSVAFGTAPYTFDYVILDEANNEVFSLMNSDSNTFEVTDGLEYFNEYTLYVGVTDSLGNTTSETHKFIPLMLAPA